jgi:hypothetical protein
MSHRKILAGLLIISGIITAGFISAGNYPIQKIARQLDKWAGNYPVEKAYLQFDKPYYAVGDTMWFKAYVTLGSRHKLSGLSNILNVELIDDRDSIKQHIKLPLISGLTWGSLTLPDTLPEGNYRVRAYTNYMRNAGEYYFFDKEFVVVNASTNKVFTKATYTYTKDNGRQKVNVLISYTDLDGSPYINKEVRYSVELDSKSITRGKGTTDNNGNLNISFINTRPGVLKSGRIISTLKTDDKIPVTKEILIKAASANVDIQFFPESGNLVSGINSKVAFKAVGADGLGADIKGTITDGQNNTITNFTSTHLGMGEFDIQPQDGKLYKAHIIYADGSENTVDLPKAADKGYVLGIDNSDPDEIHIKISASQALLLENPGDTLSLVAQSGGEVFYAAKSKPGGKSFIASVAKSRFPSGIVQFTLFSSKGEPLNERLIFIQNPDLIKLDISTPKTTYATQEKVKISLHAKTSELKPDIGSFSAAVIDETKVPVDEVNETSILSDLLLTSDLRGYIEKPNYYFTNINDTTRTDLDVLMLTQGYRRFEWKQILNDNFPPLVYRPEKAIEISGHITTPGGKPVPGGHVTLLSTTGGTFFLDTITDAQGHFVFKNMAFKDSVKFVIQARTDKNHKNVQIDLDINPQTISGNKNAPDMQVNITNGLLPYLQNSKNLYAEQLKYGLGDHTIVLKEVEIKDTQPVLKNSENLNGAGNADQVITANQLSTGCITLQQCLEGRLAGVYFQNGIPYSTRSNRPMAVNIDGAVIPGDQVSMIDTYNIESIEVLRSVAYLAVYGPQGANGMLVITTKRGDDGKSYGRPVPGIITYSPIGYSPLRVFYSPRYDNPKTNIHVANLRSTIYWNPNIITDKDGNASFEYFNAGSKGTYRLVIEGIDNDGNIGREVFHYKVE